MKKIYLCGAAALAMLFTACSADDPNQPDLGKVSDINQTLYVNMSIHGDNLSASRAAADNGTPDAGSNFDAGTPQENAVNNAYFVFYDVDGNVVGDIVPVGLGNPTASTTTDGTIDQYYKSVVPVSVRKGEKVPVGVICYINPISPSSLQNPLSVIQTVSRDRIHTSIGGQNYLAMSNSVYYPSNTNSDGTPQVVVAINPDTQLFQSEADAQKATDGLVVDVYVERYAAKLTFNAEPEGANEPYQTGTRVFGASETEYTENPVVLTFTPQFWALNAQCNTSYVVKSFRRETSGGEILADNYPYGVLNYRINVADPLAPVNYDAAGATLSAADSWAWNNPAYHRSYWSISPAYFQSEYPEVASDVEKITVPNQDYLTYAELPTKGYAKGNAAFTAPHYFRETTVGTKALNGTNPAAAVPSVIYVGQYTLSVNGTAVAGNPNFYTYLKGPVAVGEGETATTEQRPYIYFEANDNGESVVAGGESMLKRFCVQSTILFTKNATTGEYEELGLDNYTTFINALEVAEIKPEVKAVVDGTSNTELKLQANARSLQFKSAAAANNAGIYIASGNGYKTLVADDATPTADQIKISEANSILMQQVGYAYFYNAGKSYFNIPVKHFGWYRTGNVNNKEGAALNWNLVRVGDFGMVRNHSYTIKVNKITGLASGISGDNTPIVPPAATQDYYVSYRVNILKWAVVPTQNVNL